MRPVVIAGTMEQGDARATMGLQDALKLPPEDLHYKMLPANRTFVLRRTSKTMCAAVENAKLDTIVVRRDGVKFRNGAGASVWSQRAQGETACECQVQRIGEGCTHQTPA